MAKKLYEESRIADIAEKIREKTGGEETYTTAEMPEGVDAVFEAGKKSEYDAFWDANQQNGNRTNYSYAYAFNGFTDANFKPKYPIGNGSDLNLNNAFRNAEKITNIPLIKIVSWTNCTDTFYGCTELQEIGFDGTIAQNINFADCAKLSRASVENVVDHLSNATGKTITFNLSVKNNFTDIEWNTLIATKPNWTISLV